LKVTQQPYAGFHGALFVEVGNFMDGGKPENPEKNPRSNGEDQQTTLLTYDNESGNRTRVTVVRVEYIYLFNFNFKSI
jgi:hypothetical protein